METVHEVSQLTKVSVRTLTENIDKAGGDGTADFVAKVIELFTNN